MTRQLEQEVRNRAHNRCEYCQLPQAASAIRFPLDHVIARQHRGGSESNNLALCCARCNRFKGPNIAGIDPVAMQMERLYNPRTDVWSEHFQWRGLELAGSTAVGRTTIAVLNINDESTLAVRMQLNREGQLFG